MLNDSVKATIREALLNMRNRYTTVAANFSAIHKDGIWHPYNVTQPKIDAIDEALAAIEQEAEASVPMEALTNLLGRKWIPTNPMWGIADDNDKRDLAIVHKWLDSQRTPGKDTDHE